LRTRPPRAHRRRRPGRPVRDRRRGTMTAEGPLIYIVAGEPSGDLLGGRLMAALKERTGGAVRFAGIGGEAMAAEGLASRVPLSELAVMGLAEVLPRAHRIF